LLFSEGEHQGSLSGVTFTAASSTDTRVWFAINCGQFEGAFIRLMPRSRVKMILAALVEGEEIELPGLYQEEQFDCGFRYEWSPVHLVVPPSYCVRPECNEVSA